jgi:hypothetical protein
MAEEQFVPAFVVPQRRRAGDGFVAQYELLRAVVFVVVCATIINSARKVHRDGPPHGSRKAA